MKKQLIELFQIFHIEFHQLTPIKAYFINIIVFNLKGLDKT